MSNITKQPSEDAKPVIPNWFSPDTLTTCWYNWDWRYGSDDQDRFALDATDKYWTARVDKEWCKRIETQHNNSDFHCLIDLDEQTELFYKIDTQFELKISLKVKTGDANSSYATVPVGTLTAGKIPARLIFRIIRSCFQSVTTRISLPFRELFLNLPQPRENALRLNASSLTQKTLITPATAVRRP